MVENKSFIWFYFFASNPFTSKIDSKQKSIVKIFIFFLPLLLSCKYGFHRKKINNVVYALINMKDLLSCMQMLFVVKAIVDTGWLFSSLIQGWEIMCDFISSKAKQVVHEGCQAIIQQLDNLCSLWKPHFLVTKSCIWATQSRYGDSFSFFFI